MILVDIVNRNKVTHPWGEGEYLPREDPLYSRKMLEEYLGKVHDEAGKQGEIIDRHAGWIHEVVLSSRQTKILEIRCGPGLYTSRLAKLGHESVGIDDSPAAITYAREQAQQDSTNCTYIGHDLNSAEYGDGYGLVMMIGGDFNTFNPMDAYEFIGKAWRALDEGGILLLEPYTFDALEGLRKREPVWNAVKDGPFSDKPYICLHESCWNDANDSLTKRWYTIDTETAFVRYFAQCFQAYTKKRLQKLLVKSDFINVRFYPSLSGVKDTSHDDFMAVTAVKTCKYV